MASVARSGRRWKRARQAGAGGEPAPAAPARPPNSQVSLFVHRGGLTERASAVDPSWLAPGSGAIVWLDLVSPGPAEAALLRGTFHFHELAIEDALGETDTPKVESYDGYLYLILHGIDVTGSAHRVTTHDTDFFIGPNFLVTVHDGLSRTIAAMRDLCLRNDRIVGEGAAALLHRIVDSMVDSYRPEFDTLQDRIDDLEDRIFESPDRDTVRQILDLKREIASLRRVLIPQRDVVGRLARREFALVDVEIAYRFRDVYDHLVRLTDETIMFQDRSTSILEAHVSHVSNRLNEVMKVLTVVSTIFMPLTVMTGMFGMNVALPRFLGGERVQFWWILLGMLAVSGSMLWWFRRRGWI